MRAQPMGPLVDSLLASIPPLWVLMGVVAGLHAAAYKTIVGRRGHSLLRCYLFALAGLLVGQVAGQHLLWTPLLLGELHLLGTTAGAWAALIFANHRRV